MPQNGPKSPKMGPGGPLMACRGATPFPQPTTTNCQPTIANRHQAPTDNQARLAQKRSKMEIFNSGPRHLGMVKRTFLGHLGPALTRFQPDRPVLAQFPLGLETVTECNMGPKPVKNCFFQKWPKILWEGQTDLSGPFWTCFDQFYGYTGDPIPDTGHRHTPSPTVFQHTRWAEYSTGPKPVESELFQKWPRIIFGSVKRT